MHPNEKIINKFYEAFQQRNSSEMSSCYHDNIVFEDPAFGILKGEEAKQMWHMLVSRATDLDVTHYNVKADNEKGHAQWEAKYTFSKTGRKIHNRIDATFTFKNGLIISHTDRFNFWKWSRMALGPFGLFFGYTPIVKNKVRTTAKKALKKYIEGQ